MQSRRVQFVAASNGELWRLLNLGQTPGSLPDLLWNRQKRRHRACEPDPGWAHQGLSLLCGRREVKPVTVEDFEAGRLGQRSIPMQAREEIVHSQHHVSGVVGLWQRSDRNGLS